MRILISGASGLIGGALSKAFADDDHEVFTLVRQELSDSHAIYWKPSENRIDSSTLEGFDVVIHLGGANLANGRWTESRKQVLVDSRVRSTTLLAESIAGLTQKPNVFICASAIGYYGSRGAEELTEQSRRGEGFLADLTAQWEDAAQPAARAGIRTVNLRLGMVLAAEGGALAQMLTPFRLGIGGKLGSGEQYWSWVTLEDVVGLVKFAIETQQLSGPVNVVAPLPLTNKEFTRTLGNVLHRPTILPAPAFGLKLLLGEMAEEAILASQRVVPKKLQDFGYAFTHSDLASALRDLLNRPA